MLSILPGVGSGSARTAPSTLSQSIRMADSLARGHPQGGSDLRFERQGDELTVYLPGGGDLLLKQRAMADKGDLFEDIYGLKVRLEQV